jgi:hypothetical protein
MANGLPSEAEFVGEAVLLRSQLDEIYSGHRVVRQRDAEVENGLSGIDYQGGAGSLSGARRRSNCNRPQRSSCNRCG